MIFCFPIIWFGRGSIFVEAVKFGLKFVFFDLLDTDWMGLYITVNCTHCFNFKQSFANTLYDRYFVFKAEFFGINCIQSGEIRLLGDHHKRIILRNPMILDDIWTRYSILELSHPLNLKINLSVRNQ